jgi:hypothetical protein
MKCKYLILLFCLLITVPEKSKAQNDLSYLFHSDSSAANTTKLERIAYVCGASLAFSLFDYIGYNLCRYNNKAPLSYRLLQAAVQGGISYYLFRKCGLPSAISFNIIWWTWGDDLAYYGWGDIANPSWAHNLNPQWTSSHSFRTNDITWAGWTPIGLLHRKGAVIDKFSLLTQAMIGFYISIAIL